jgi:hypothetical protein
VIHMISAQTCKMVLLGEQLNYLAWRHVSEPSPVEFSTGCLCPPFCLPEHPQTLEDGCEVKSFDAMCNICCCFKFSTKSSLKTKVSLAQLIRVGAVVVHPNQVCPSSSNLGA